jgi:hypothetical protein
VTFFPQKSKSIILIDIFAIFSRIINNYKLLELSSIQRFFLQTLDEENFALFICIRDSSPNQIGTLVSRRSSHTTQLDYRQTTAMGSRLLYDALFAAQHHSHKLVTPRAPIYA